MSMIRCDKYPFLIFVTYDAILVGVELRTGMFCNDRCHRTQNIHSELQLSVKCQLLCSQAIGTSKSRVSCAGSCKVGKAPNSYQCYFSCRHLSPFFMPVRVWDYWHHYCLPSALSPRRMMPKLRFEIYHQARPPLASPVRVFDMTVGPGIINICIPFHVITETTHLESL